MYIIVNRYSSFHIEIDLEHEEMSHLFQQHRQLYLMMRKMGDDIANIKEELRKQKNDRDNDLSPAVFDISLFIIERNDIT